MSNETVMNTYTKKVVELGEIATRRNLPFTQTTLDQLRNLRHMREDEHFADTGESIIVPMPIIIAQAVEEMHEFHLGFTTYNGEQV